MAEGGGMLFGEGPAACPFVALESDRDRRVDEPDHRHRCYAEPEPAPRAIAHQRAYCLSAAFPSCPIFQDWAVRAAARPVPLRPGAVLPAEEEPPSMPDWAAPPPWAAGPDPDEPQQLGAFDRPPEAAPGAGQPSDPPLPSWSAADRAAAPETVVERPSRASDAPAEPIERVPSLPVDRTGDAERDAQLEAQRQQRMLEERERRQEDERRRRADEERRERERQATAAASVPPFLAGRADAAGATAQVTPPSRPQGPAHGSAGQAAAPHAAAVAASRQAAARAPSKEEWAARREDLVPVWEREPIHAYPSMRRRISIGGGDAISTMTTLLAVVAAIALVVFVIIALPSFLGGGGSPSRTNAPGGVVSPSAPGASAAPSATPTAVPAETPRTYTVQPGDSLFAIAARFGLTVDQLLAANPQITNADYVTIGQVIIIPDRDFAVPTPTAAP